MKTNDRRVILIAVSALLLAAMACGLPRPATPPAIPTVPLQAGGASPAPTQPPTEPTAPEGGADDTPVPDVSGPGGCTLNSAYVADVTVPDNTEFAPGASFTKTWRVRNSGTCDWEAGTKLVFVSGDVMDGPAEVPVGTTAPGSNTDVGVNLVAPSSPGTYKGNWQMQDPKGVRFGSVVYVKIVVPAPATATPTATPTETPTVEATQPSGCVAPHATLKPVLDHANAMGYDMGCATAPASIVQGAFQEFWTNVDDPNPHTHFRSLMIWRADKKEIDIIVGEDTSASRGVILAYTDFWEEGDPEIHPDCVGMTPPSGYELPKRGFGRVWCYNHLESQVGWPAQTEVTADLLIQPMQTGVLMKVSGPMSIHYLIAMDYQAVYAVTMMAAP